MLFEEARISEDSSFRASVAITSEVSYNPLVPFCLPLLVISHVDNIHSHLWDCSDRVVLIQTYLRVIHWQTPPERVHPHSSSSTVYQAQICVYSYVVTHAQLSCPLQLLLLCSFSVLSGSMVFMLAKVT